MANPGGGGNPRKGKGSRAIQEVLDGGRFLPGVNYIPLPRIGEGLGEWFEALSYGKRGLGKMRWLQAEPATGFGGIPHRAKP